ncbi:MAG: tRNA (adenosine(37)-N6)-dimethylallyltransferase MiaA [Parcubacteria group bacterium]|nr:tRNA (adenosine(37)-N6)-dimethylallyltransferase MiaA [Parcubacteria group bacterium]
MRILPKLIVIFGPTGSGKTELSLSLAKCHNGEIVSADSVQVYRGMNIGTAKIVPERQTTVSMQNVRSAAKKRFRTVRSEYRGVSHYMLDIRDPDQPMSVAMYGTEVLRIVNNIHSRKKIPFLVGGSGHYIEAITHSLPIPRVAPDMELRKKWEMEIKKDGIAALYAKLIDADPAIEGMIDRYNPRRVIRALEIITKLQKPLSEIWKKGKPRFDVLFLCPAFDRDALYQNIDRRVDRQVADGLLDEVRSLGERFGYDIPAMLSIGYRQMGRHLKGEIDLTTAIELLKRDTRRYAKRQMTWMRRISHIHRVRDASEAEKLIQTFLTR